MKAMVLALGLVAVVAAVVGLGLARSFDGAQAQGQVTPDNVRVADGFAAGEVVVAWDAVEDAAYYRVGWVLMSDISAVQAEGRDWLDAFDFKDVENKGQTTQTLRGLLPGELYAFTVGIVGQRFGVASSWSEWTLVTVEDAPSYPTDTATPTPAPEPTPAPTNTPAPTDTFVLTGTPMNTPTPAPTNTPAPTATFVPTATPAATSTPAPTPASRDYDTDYDTDDDGLIEIANLSQLDIIRYDLDGDGNSTYADGYAAAFPDAMLEMGCPAGCSGYELVADLDFDTNGNGRPDAGDAYWDGDAGWLPIGDPYNLGIESWDQETEHRYNAVFNGGGHTIANLFIHRTEGNYTGGSYAGLFWATGYHAEIRNVRLTGVRVIGQDWAGGLVGSNGGRIAGSSVAGQVTGRNAIGGLAGYNSGIISDSSAVVAVYGSGGQVGGLVGRNPGVIADSYASGTVAGAGDVGGLVGSGGWRSCGKIIRSHAAGSVTSGDEGHVVGGLIGYNCGAIRGSYATGRVTGNNVGGLVGYNNTGVITASYATGRVVGRGYNAGGLAGYCSGAITASYATGRVSGGGNDVSGLVGYASSCRITSSYAVGEVIGNWSGSGLVGNNRHSNIIAHSYWDTQTSGVSGEDASGSYRGVGKTTEELQEPTAAAGIYASWNAEWWDFGDSRQYPALKYQGMDVAAQRR